jgi:hypothetical protein
MDDGNTYTVATKAYYAPKSPYKLLLKSALKKRKKLYIRPNKEIDCHTIRRYSNDFAVGRATCKNGLYVIRQALTPQYIAHALTAKRQISRTISTAKETARQLTANSLLAGRESMIPTIAYKKWYLEAIRSFT